MCACVCTCVCFFLYACICVCVCVCVCACTCARTTWSGDKLGPLDNTFFWYDIAACRLQKVNYIMSKCGFKADATFCGIKIILEGNKEIRSLRVLIFGHSQHWQWSGTICIFSAFPVRALVTANTDREQGVDAPLGVYVLPMLCRLCNGQEFRNIGMTMISARSTICARRTQRKNML